MKIRQGYVSNSSSSSFLILYNNENEFNKFKSFDGYETFIKDLKKKPLKQMIINDISKIISDYIYAHGNCFDNGYSTYDYYDKLYSLCELSDIKWELFIEDLHAEVSMMKEKMLEKIKKEDENLFNLFMILHNSKSGIQDIIYHFDNNISNFWIKHYQQYDKKFFKYFYSKKLESKIRKTAKLIYNNLKEKYKVNSIIYNDEDDKGNYMEHYFLPFLTQNPDNKTYKIFIQGEH